MSNFIKTPSDMYRVIGQTGKAANGQRITIIAARDVADIDVMFTDGMPVWHTSYIDFKNGLIERPEWPSPGPGTNIRVGRMGTSKEGYPISILAYRSHRDIDVIFEDGTYLVHKTYPSFRDGKISYPKRGKGRKAG